MQLQDIFFLLGSIFMVLLILVLVFILVTLYSIKKRLTDTRRMIEQKIQLFMRPSGEAVVGIGSAIVGAAVEKIKSAINKKKKTS